MDLTWVTQGSGQVRVKIEKWSDPDKNFRVYVAFDVSSESEVVFSVFFKCRSRVGFDY